jgi:hypothetical protein
MFVLGGHTQTDEFASEIPLDDKDHTRRMRVHLRTLFWLCYTFDKDISLRTGQPPAIDDEHCDLTLPKNHERSRFGMFEDDEGTPHVPGDLRLSIVKSKTFKLLYSAKALRKSDTDLLRDIRELDDELEEWRLSIEPISRPTLSGRSGHSWMDPDATIIQIMHTIVTHFEYHYLIATIHRATGRCRSWANGDGGEMEGVSSSLELSVEASRSTLIYLRAAVHNLVGPSFW